MKVDHHHDPGDRNGGRSEDSKAGVLARPSEASTALERAREAWEEHERRVPVQLSLPKEGAHDRR